jgi:hypothetical protein
MNHRCGRWQNGSTRRWRKQRAAVLRRDGFRWTEPDATSKQPGFTTSLTPFCAPSAVLITAAEADETSWFFGWLETRTLPDFREEDERNTKNRSN